MPFTNSTTTADHQALLEKHGLRKTQTRLAILQAFLSRDFALSHRDLEEALGDAHFDRVTIYRTLYSFEEAGLIHKVVDDANVIKYAVCDEHCAPLAPRHAHNHLHLTCVRCEKTYCVQAVEIPTLQIPAHFKVESLHLFAKGVCEGCAET